jgi:hypothetical protein
MRTWQLEPGKYKITEGPDENDDGLIDDVQREREVMLAERVNSIDIDLPGKKGWVVFLEQIANGIANDASYPDLALTPKDIALPTVIKPDQQIEVEVGIHNIGSFPAEDAVIQFIVNGRLLDSARIDRIDAPNDLHPKRKGVRFRWVAQRGINHLAFRIVSHQKEITQLNNFVTRSVTTR